jgi:hypothetical protein
LYQRLANAGQKCLTVSINDLPWKQQTFDAYRSMIDWIKQPDGSWTYDYSKFDEYVAFGEACGIVGQINCYSMVPFRGYDFYYLDAVTGDRKKVSAKPGSRAILNCGLHSSKISPGTSRQPADSARPASPWTSVRFTIYRR